MLDLTTDPGALTAALVDIQSVSRNEQELADQVDRALQKLGHLEVSRIGNAIVARTQLNRPKRVVFAGHLDTVPVADNFPSFVESGRLFGVGSSDMKSGIAVMLRIAAMVSDPAVDLTFVFYDCEEINRVHNGLNRIIAQDPGYLEGDLAIVMEPTAGLVEAGCLGTMRATINISGRRAHSARSWLGINAIHESAPVLQRLTNYEPRIVDLDGCSYREGLNAVAINGGVAGNIIPDECTIQINYRFAPDLTIDQASAHLSTVFSDFPVNITDAAPAAPPRLDLPTAQAFLAAVGTPPKAKSGWTDVATFAELGIPALNYGPGDPNLAHTREESVEISKIFDCEKVVAGFLTSLAE